MDIKEQYQQAYRIMAIFISVSFFIHLFLMYNDFFIHTWYGARDAVDTLSVTVKDYGLAHAFEVAVPLAMVILLLSSRVRKKTGAMIISCCFLIMGVFVHRFLLMPGSFDKIPLTISPLGLQNVEWAAPIASGRYDLALDTFVTRWHYFPSGIEMAIFLGVVAYAGFLIILAMEMLPIVREAE